MDLWICGQKRNSEPDDNAWEFQGVYSTEQKAIDVCKTDLYFIGPATLNDSFPDGIVKWPGAYYPKVGS